MPTLTFEQQCELDWNNLEDFLFQANIPEGAEWTNKHDIIKVLSAICKYANTNHTFFPNGGGMDLKGIKFVENDLTELDFGRIYLAKIKKIQFNGFTKNPIWNYFRLEIDNVTPTGIYNGVEYSEVVTEIKPGQYIHRKAWDEKMYNELPLPFESRLVTRLLKGSFVIFRKDSIYSRNTNNYDGRHDKKNAALFREYIERLL